MSEFNGSSRPDAAPVPENDNYWLARSVRTVLFLAVALTLAGVYAFFKTPIAVFPETNFPARGDRRGQRRDAR